MKNEFYYEVYKTWYVFHVCFTFTHQIKRKNPVFPKYQFNEVYEFNSCYCFHCHVQLWWTMEGHTSRGALVVGYHPRKKNHIIMLYSEPGNVPGGTQLFSGRVCPGAARISKVWGLPTDICLWKRGLLNWKFQNLGACELKISKYGGLRAKIWAKIEAV